MSGSKKGKDYKQLYQRSKRNSLTIEIDDFEDAPERSEVPQNKNTESKESHNLHNRASNDKHYDLDHSHTNPMSIIQQEADSYQLALNHEKQRIQHTGFNETCHFAKIDEDSQSINKDMAKPSIFNDGKDETLRIQQHDQHQAHSSSRRPTTEKGRDMLNVGL